MQHTGESKEDLGQTDAEKRAVNWSDYTSYKLHGLSSKPSPCYHSYSRPSIKMLRLNLCSSVNRHVSSDPVLWESSKLGHSPRLMCVQACVSVHAYYCAYTNTAWLFCHGLHSHDTFWCFRSVSNNINNESLTPDGSLGNSNAADNKLCLSPMPKHTWRCYC